MEFWNLWNLQGISESALEILGIPPGRGSPIVLGIPMAAGGKGTLSDCYYLDPDLANAIQPTKTDSSATGCPDQNLTAYINPL
jgi:hypothetical protein